MTLPRPRCCSRRRAGWTERRCCRRPTLLASRSCSMLATPVSPTGFPCFLIRHVLQGDVGRWKPVFVARFFCFVYPTTTLFTGLLWCVVLRLHTVVVVMMMLAFFTASLLFTTNCGLRVNPVYLIAVAHAQPSCDKRLSVVRRGPRYCTSYEC